MKPNREPNPRDFELAVVCGVISLPFHYVFWTSVFEWVRDKPVLTATPVLVVCAAGVVALVLTWLALSLSKSNSRVTTVGWRLPNPVLFVVSFLLIGNAIYQYKTRNYLACIQSLAVSIGAFLLARDRSRGE